MSIHQRKELNMVEGNTCSCSCPMWKPTSPANGNKSVTKLHHKFLCTYYYEHNVRGDHP